MQRVLQNSGATITATFEVDDVATDPAPDTATVTITRSDGTVLATDGVTNNIGVGEFSYTLTPTQTSVLDTLTATWKATIDDVDHVVTSRVEVAGGFLFSLPEARDMDPLNDATTYPTAMVRRYRTLAEQALEDLCNVAFVPRYTVETVTGGPDFLTSKPKVRAIRSVSIDGVDRSDMFASNFQATGRVESSVATARQMTAQIGYEHGYDEPPLRVRQAALLLAKNWMVRGPLDDRVTALQTQDGIFPMMTPGVRGSLTEIPEVEAVIQIYGYPAGIA
jgi:hypothetical protein